MKDFFRIFIIGLLLLPLVACKKNKNNGGTGSSEGYVGGDNDDTVAVLENKIHEAVDVQLPIILTKNQNGVPVLTLVPMKGCSFKINTCSTVAELTDDQRRFLALIFEKTINRAVELGSNKSWSWSVDSESFEAEGTDAESHDVEARFDLGLPQSQIQHVEFSFPALKNNRTVNYLTGLAFHEQLHILTRLADKAEVVDLIAALGLTGSVDLTKLGNLRVGNWFRYAARFIEAALEDGKPQESASEWLGDPNSGNTILEMFEYENNNYNTHLYSASKTTVGGFHLTSNDPYFRLIDATKTMSESAQKACEKVQINICLENPTVDIGGHPVYMNGYAPNAYYLISSHTATYNGCREEHDRFSGTLGYGCKNAAKGLVPLRRYVKGLSADKIPVGNSYYWYLKKNYVGRFSSQIPTGYRDDGFIAYVLPPQ